ncbi:heterokaryon incompatibility protein-domain-containing protein [Hypoxylon rubiginosum]|uniref:Heterokaryon incompatibility protein-domain-containing protein n=1 Tax=Hypoxylon rubiginosum TaxID=110542 RepID=A0ACC0CRW0_9PEZI|nr:heterokaryon incompatibility protein-domain-containing protein [Hypoxylon rubiginosum]
MSGLYIYETFPPHSASGAHIRLLTLLPAESEADAIHCKLDIVALADCPTYEALSYCWGPQSPQYSIDCDGLSFTVGENLHSALSHLRHVNEDRKLWIDAICINQNDLSEKADQVLLMRDIYRDAQRVLVWLGPAALDSGLAFDTLRRLSGYWTEMSERWAIDKLSVLKLGPFRDTLRQLFGVKAGQQKDIEDDPRFKLQPREIAALHDVLGRAWWRRTWVIQEVCLAEQVVLACGNSALSWEELSHGYLIAIGPGGMLTTIGATEGLDCCQKMYQLKTMFQGKQQQEATSDPSPPTRKDRSEHTTIDMLTLVQMSNKFGTARYHDRIYGVLGLATVHPAKHSPTKTDLSIVPDYTTTVEKCFQDAAIAIMKDSGNLDLFMDTTYRLKQGVNLPSWVPHWGYDPFESSENEAWGSATPFTSFLSIAVLVNLFRQQEVQVRACGENSKCEPRVVEGSVLVLEGHIVDSVATIAPALDGKLDDDTEEKWAQYAKQHKGVSFTTIPSLISQVLVRVAAFAGSLLAWEELAFANPACPTKAEQEIYIKAMLSDRLFQDIDVSLGIYQRDWSPLLRWLRRLSPLKALGTRPGSLTLYNAVAGISALVFLTWSSTKSHLVTIAGAMETRMARTDAGRLARLPGPARAGDKIALLRGSKMPVVIRLVDHRWQVIGCCYVDGIMYGEGWRPGATSVMEFA